MRTPRSRGHVTLPPGGPAASVGATRPAPSRRSLHLGCLTGGARRLTSQVDRTEIIEDGSTVVVPDARQLLLWVSSIGVGSVTVELIIPELCGLAPTHFRTRRVADSFWIAQEGVRPADGGDEPAHAPEKGGGGPAPVIDQTALFRGGVEGGGHPRRQDQSATPLESVAYLSPERRYWTLRGLGTELGRRGQTRRPLPNPSKRDRFSD